MNLTTLIRQYFPLSGNDVTIDVFDEKNIYDVYQRVVGVLTQYVDIETTILQAMSYCFYEVLDNVITHSGKDLGTVITHYDSCNHILSFLVADDGVGVQASLSENEDYNGISETEALRICIKDAITDGKGMGFGLYSTSLLAQDAGLRFEVRSGAHTLLLKDGVESMDNKVAAFVLDNAGLIEDAYVKLIELKAPKRDDYATISGFVQTNKSRIVNVYSHIEYMEEHDSKFNYNKMRKKVK